MTSSLVLTPPQPAVPAARASWNGQLALGPLLVPVKAYPALVVPNQGPLHQIHIGCGERISQRKTCPKHGELESKDIGKAFAFAPGDQLTFSAEELDSLAPPDDQTIRIEHLMPSNAFDHTLLSGRALYLAPTHAAATSAYARAIALLGATPHWGVGAMILSDQRRTIAVRVEERRLLLFVLHAPEHRRTYPGPELERVAIPPTELRALEKSLVPLHKSFAWSEYRDDAAERLNDLIQRKLAARKSSAGTSAGKARKGARTAVVAAKGRAA
jgi:DNA end-binding protein Ku